MMKYFLEHKNGIIGTLITHVVILILLLLFGFFTPLPLPSEEGILVNFGNSENGFGPEEPAPGETAPVENQEEKIASTTVKKVTPSPNKEELLTQDFEKTIALEAAKKKKAEDREKDKLLKEKQKQEQLEKQKQNEADQVRKAELVRQKDEENRRLALAAEEKRKAGEISSRAKNAFGGNGKGSPDSKSTSQGVTFGPGNQGTAGGSANAEIYGPGGGVGNGVSFSLDGRSALSLPKPYYPGNEEGLVVVQVTVNKTGQVTKAEAGVKGSNTTDQALIAAAKKAALQAKFNVNANAPEFQTGTITYRFVLN
jgi:TonB family protein